MLSASGLSNKFGLKRIWMLAMALFTASSLLCAFAGNISLLLVGRSIQGAAGAVIIPGAMSIIFHAFDDAKLRAKVVGGWSTFSAIGLIVGPLLGGFLVDHTGWLGGMTYALIAAGHAGLLAPEVTVPLTGSCILFGVFLFRQSRTANPLLPLPLFRQTGFGIPNLASFILGFSTYSSLFFFSLFFQEAQGVSASEAGVRLMPQFLLTAIVSLFFGRLHSRVGTRWLMVTSYALIGVAMVLLCFAEVQTGYVYTGSLLALMGVGMGVAVPVTGVCVLGAVEKARFATASAVMNALRQGGMAFGIAILGALLGAEAVKHATRQLTADGISQAALRAQTLVFSNAADAEAALSTHYYREAIAYGFQSAMLAAGAACLVMAVILAVQGKSTPPAVRR